MLIEEAGIEGRVHVQLFQGLVNLDKFVADISKVKGLRRGLIMKGSKLEEVRGVKVKGKRRADRRYIIDRLRGRRTGRRWRRLRG